MKNRKIGLISALIAVVFILPQVGKAAAIEEMEAQINALLAQIKTLEEQLAQLKGQPAEVKWCYTFNKNLRVGDEGIEVQMLRVALMREGFDEQLGSGSRSKSFGEDIASAVSGFQEKYREEILTPLGLKYGTGYVGPSTRKKLNQLYGCGIVPPISQTRYSASPTYLVRGQIYPMSASVTNAKPNAQVLFYLQRPDGTFKYYATPFPTDPNNIIGNFNGGVTNADGVWKGEVGGGYQIDLQGQNGTWVSWVTVGGVQSNKVYHTVAGGDSTQPSIRVLSPNGGEQWTKGMAQTIKWSWRMPVYGDTAPTGFIDIALQSWTPPCNDKTQVCPKMPVAVYTLAKGVFANNAAFEWKVGFTGDGSEIPAGQYVVRITDSYNNISDQSDAPFSIISSLPPSADIKANGSDGPIAVAVGQNITYAWSSANADAYSSSYVVDSPQCNQIGTGPFGWIVNTASGTTSGTTSSCQDGHTYTITYKVTQTTTGLSAQDTVVVNVLGSTTAGPTAHWKFDEGSGTTALDSSGSGNTITLINGVSWVPGRQGSALSFDGIDDRADFDSGASLNFASDTPFTYTGWFKTTDPSGMLLSQRNSASGSSVINLSIGHNGVDLKPGKFRLLVRQDESPIGVGTVESLGAVNDGGWHHFVAIRQSGGKISLYIDGGLQGTDINTGAAGSVTTNMRSFGVDRQWQQQSFATPNDRFFNGVIDDVRVYNRALTASEIIQIYVDGGGVVGSSASPSYTASVLDSMQSILDNIGAIIERLRK